MAACGTGAMTSQLEAAGEAATPDWGSLPADLALEVCKALLRIGGSLEPVLGTCHPWREAGRELVGEVRPLGQPPRRLPFPLASSLDYAARGHSHSLRDAELAAACAALGPQLLALNASGAFQLTAAGLEAACAACPRLAALALDECTLEDEGLTALRQLPALRALSLRRCMYLKGGFLAALAQQLPGLQALDLSGCGLSLHLRREVREALGAMRALTAVDLSDGNGVGDDVLQELAALPRLECLRLRGAAELTDGGLAALAEGACAAMLRTLDISYCDRLTEGCWGPLSRLAALRSLCLESLPHLLCLAPAPELLTEALWRWQRLERLSLAGSCVHPAKLKLISETCGAALLHLDIGAVPAADTPGASATVRSRHGWWPPAAAPAAGAAAGNGGGAAPPWEHPWGQAAASGGGAAGSSRRHSGCYKRLSPRQLQDLCEAMASLKALRSLRAAGTCLPLEAALALLGAAGPRLRWLDLAQCSMEKRQLHIPLPRAWHAFGAAARRGQLGGNLGPAPATAAQPATLLPPLRTARALDYGDPSLARSLAQAAMTAGAAPGPSAAAADGGEGSASSEVAQDGPAAAAAEAFAAALGVLSSLEGLNLSGCVGLTPQYLSSLSTLSGLRHLSLADCSGVGDAALLHWLGGPPAAAAEATGEEAAQAGQQLGLQDLLTLDLSGSDLSDAVLPALATLPALRCLSLARCNVTAAGLAALLGASPRCGSSSGRSCSAPALAASLRGLDLSRCSGVDDAALRLVAAHCRGLRWLRLTGCGRIGPAGVEALARRLPRLTRLVLARCPNAATDASLAAVCRGLTLLTHLDISASDHLTAAGLESLAGLRCLAQLDLTCCRRLSDDKALAVLPRVTAANVQMAQGSRSPTGSPIKHRRLL